MERYTINSHDGVPLTWPHAASLRWYRSGTFSLDDHDRNAILTHFGINHWYYRAERIDTTSPEELRGFATNGIPLESLDNQELLDLHKRSCTQYGIVMTEDQDREFMEFWGGLATSVSAVIAGRMISTPPILGKS